MSSSSGWLGVGAAHAKHQRTSFWWACLRLHRIVAFLADHRLRKRINYCLVKQTLWKFPAFVSTYPGWQPLPVFAVMLANSWLTQQDGRLRACGIWKQHGHVGEAAKLQLRLDSKQRHTSCACLGRVFVLRGVWRSSRSETKLSSWFFSCFALPAPSCRQTLEPVWLGHCWCRANPVLILLPFKCTSPCVMSVHFINIRFSGFT